MVSDDLNKDLDSPTRGGYRVNGGRKRGQAAEKYDALLLARTRHEQAKADMAEAEIARRQGEVISRAAVEQAGATLVAALVQVMRSLPDNLERRAGLPPEAVEAAEQIVDAACLDLHDRLKELGGW